MKNKTILLFSIVTTVLFILYKPIYLMLFLVIFSSEGFFFLNLAIFYYQAKKTDDYSCFETRPLKTTSIFTYKIWIKLNEIQAYKRFYSILTAKKFSWKTIVFAVILILSGFPFKVYNLLKFLLKQNLNFHQSIACLYYTEYETVDNKKIEVIFKKTYLN